MPKKKENKIINLAEPISLVCKLRGSQSMTEPFLTDGKTVANTGKARYIRGLNEKKEIVEVWVPNYWIMQVISPGNWTSLVFGWYERDMLIERMNKYLIKTKK